MDLILIIIAAILPAVLLLKYIYRKDILHPEPVSWLAKGFFFGVVSAGLSILISTHLQMMGYYSMQECASVSDAFREAFFGAAIPEEAAKLFMLWLLLRNNPYFDEKIDGIVYATCIGLGFASIENILYLFSSYEDWLRVGVMRALVSVPGHFMFAIFMGYYYSLGYWGRNLSKGILAFLIPMILHGTFDFLLMVSDQSINGIAAIVMLAFFYFFFKMKKAASQKVSDLLKDNEGYSSMFARWDDPYSDDADNQF